jgi:hypothetical protein
MKSSKEGVNDRYDLLKIRRLAFLYTDLVREWTFFRFYGKTVPSMYSVHKRGSFKRSGKNHAATASGFGEYYW